MWVELGLITGTYLYGSAPLVWGLAKLKGVNLRQFGSYNIGMANLIAATGNRRLGAIGFIFDFSKGIVPIVIGYYLLDLEIKILCLAGIAALLGHIYPVFLSFSGGRGGTAGGSVAVGFMIAGLLSWKIVAVVTPLVAGFTWRNLRSRHSPSRSVPLGMLFTFALLPLATWLWDGANLPFILTFVVILAIIIIRRLTADLRRDLREKPSTTSTRKILLNRFLYDRSYRERYH